MLFSHIWLPKRRIYSDSFFSPTFFKQNVKRADETLDFCMHLHFLCLLLIADAVLYLRRPIVAVDCTVVCAHDVSPPGTLLTTLYRLHCILLDNIVVTSHACVSEYGVFQRSTL